MQTRRLSRTELADLVHAIDTLSSMQFLSVTPFIYYDRLDKRFCVIGPDSECWSTGSHQNAVEIFAVAWHNRVVPKASVLSRAKSIEQWKQRRHRVLRQMLSAVYRKQQRRLPELIRQLWRLYRE